MRICIYDKESLASFKMELPDTVSKLGNLVITNEKGDEVYELKDTVPADIHRKNELRDQFEQKEFDNLMLQFPEITSENPDPDLEEKVVLAISLCIKTTYPELAALGSLEAISRTIASHFIPYAAMKTQEKMLNDQSRKEQKSVCFAKDYALRFIELFGGLDLKDPKSVLHFADRLKMINTFMRADTRRKAGVNKLLHGVTETMNKMAQVFFTDQGENKIDIIRAFQDVSKHNEEMLRVKANFDKCMGECIAFFKTFTEGSAIAVKEVLQVHPDADIAFLAVMRGLVVQLVMTVDEYFRFAQEPNHSLDEKKEKALDYQKKMQLTLTYIDDLIMMYDDYYQNNIPNNEYAKNLGLIWDIVTIAKNNEEDVAWAYHLAVQLQSQFEELFKGIPTDLTAPAKGEQK